MRALNTLICAAALTVGSQAAYAACDAGEIVIKFSHVTNTDRGTVRLN
jgi:C4-dicarboxylate-binding protein DctP